MRRFSCCARCRRMCGLHSTQYGVKFLVDTLAGHAPARRASGSPSFCSSSLIAADNLLWRVASWIASFAFVGVTGDLRRDLFRHLTGHAPSYFADRLPGMLTSRITATSNAVFTVENMFIWNVLPPCAATVGAIAFVLTVSGPMAAGLIVVGGIVVIAMFRLAAAGKPLHHDFADKAAAVDGEMVDVIGNMPLVRAFGGLVREHKPLRRHASSAKCARAGAACCYLERLRLLHAAGDDRADHRPAGLGDHAVAARRGDHRRRRAGMHARTFGPARHARSGGRAGRRDPAHGAAVGGAGDAADPARAARPSGGRSRWCGAAPASSSSDVSFRYPDGRQVFDEFQPAARARASASGWSAVRAAASRPCSPCCSDSTTCRAAAS